VALVNAEDSSLISGTTTDLNGGFKLDNIERGSYLIKVQYLGYQTYYSSVQVNEDLSLPELALIQQAQTLEQVHITAEATMSTQKGDTTQFNASAYTTLADVSGIDLVEKMPRIMIQDGKLQAQGEDVSQI